ncbi:MAG: helix-turn-helix domain-containing protein [Bacteroidetes bacterium]|nr:helix-turn-helix domain-containing protein [Bacteroidota bacterium]
MGLIAALSDIDKKPRTVFVMHEKSEKLIPLHKHNKGQLSYVEGGIAYITIGLKTYVVPAHHYLWIPKNTPHVLRVGYSATVLRSLFFYAHDDKKHAFYEKLGIYPASELLIQMISYTERWDGKSVGEKDSNFEFLVAIKNILPKLNNQSLAIVLPVTEDERLLKILRYLEKNIAHSITLHDISMKFNMSERSISRLFQSNMHISFLQYLKTLRIIKATELILKTKQTVSEIAFSVGYDTLGAFSNTFYAYTHARPSDLRRNQKL